MCEVRRRPRSQDCNPDLKTQDLRCANCSKSSGELAPMSPFSTEKQTPFLERPNIQVTNAQVPKNILRLTQPLLTRSTAGLSQVTTNRRHELF
ncbi:hypothetical protein CEXT_682821 [Caerostris extrusa]|uniref:Uncharacterized protein n=1 Tax=Caerostris extrusa TaxID=172846 RepID=A0AAV4QXK2_CAEEX|nr:hypothetical protein CEXT_682821 [Caerostris extrusa]